MTTTWVDVPNANLSVSTTTGGSPIGLLLALTYADSNMTPGTIWTDLNNASGTSWTDIPNAT